ncbi:hypothetical protein ITQ94_08675 [Pediococcus pentosaceus]|uniref:hypothetical protein n=1 Tax=Pediococcus pentosaceus TaxID=1255 RepID=UPI0018FE61D2|nr:hypothetical protein [Pediococcus pentosaceus]MBF7131510.1 hypothetical protein [Pediococcus pentosaceus]
MLFSKGMSKQNSVPDRAQNPPSIHPKAVNKRRVTVSIFCKNQDFDEVKVFKDDLKGLPTNKMRFIEVYEEDIDEYYLIKVDDIEEIEYSKDEWEDEQ